MARSLQPTDKDPSLDQRRERRLEDARIALVRFKNEECLGMIENVSLNGLKVALFTETVPEEAEILVDGAYEDDWVTFRGRVRYASSHGAGWTVGVHCYEDCRPNDLLAARYRF